MADTPKSGPQAPDSATTGSTETPDTQPPPPTADEAASAPATEAAETGSEASSAAPEGDAERGDDDATPEAAEPAPTFAELGLPDALLAAVADMGWEQPTRVQAMTFAPMVGGGDIMVQSQTGSGKTGAFCLPWLASRFVAEPAEQTGVQLLVVLPTRELAKQVCGELIKLSAGAEVETLPVYGGTAMQPQLAALSRGVHAVVGTPGRILDHIRRRSLDLSKVRTVVLDECDEMLSMGFLEDIRAILEACPEDRQTCLFSATVPADIARIAKRYMRDPETIELSGDQVAAEEIHHIYYTVSGAMKTRDLLDVIALEEPTTALVFCNTREETNVVASVLQREGFAAEPLSSDLAQRQRERVMAKMRSGKLRFLVCTDVASRGIDISHISHVINYSFPENADSYVHRTGRTGRAGRHGAAINLIAPQELGSFYSLKLHHPSIEFEERFLPPPEELARQRMETRLDHVSQRFTELVSPEWTVLARSLVGDPRGERVVALLLERAMSQTARRRPAVEDDELPPPDEAGVAEAEPSLDAEGEPPRGRRDRRRRRRGRRGGGEGDRSREDAAARVDEPDTEATSPEPREPAEDRAAEVAPEGGATQEAADGGEPGERKRRRRRRRRRRGKAEGGETPEAAEASAAQEAETEATGEEDAATSTDTEEADAAPGDATKKRRRRRRRRGKREAGTGVAPVPQISQDQIVIDVDEQELSIVREEFGEIDELDDLTLKARRRAVIDVLQDEVELEDVSKEDAEEDEAEANGDEEAAANDEEAEANDGDAEEATAEPVADEAVAEPAPTEAPAAPAEDAAAAEPGTEPTETAPATEEAEAPAETAAPEAPKKKKRRRRRRKKKQPEPPPELTAPPHKDFWEVWAAKFNFKDFEDETFGPAEAAEDAPAELDDKWEATDEGDPEQFVRVQLNLGRSHGKKAAHIRSLLREAVGLSGRSVRDLTVGDASTMFRIDPKHVDRLTEALAGRDEDGVTLAVGLAEADAETPPEPAAEAPPVVEQPASEEEAPAAPE